MRNRRQTFFLATSRPDVESACRRALRNADWQELPTDAFTMQNPLYVGSAGGLVGELMVLMLIELLKRISPVRQRLKPMMTTTSHAPSPAPGSDAVINAVSVINSSTGEFVLLTISLRDQRDSATEVTLEGKGGLLRKAAAVVTDLRHSIEVESSSLIRGDDR